MKRISVPIPDGLEDMAIENDRSMAKEALRGLKEHVRKFKGSKHNRRVAKRKSK